MSKMIVCIKITIKEDCWCKIIHYTCIIMIIIIIIVIIIKTQDMKEKLKCRNSGDHSLKKYAICIASFKSIWIGFERCLF